MRILYLVHQYFNVGGTELHTRLLSRGLPEDMEVFVASPVGDQLLLFRNGERAGAWPWQPVDRVQTPVEVPVSNGSIRKLLFEVNPDLIHIQHFIDWPLSLFSLCLESGAPVVVSLHDYYALTPLFTMEAASSAADLVTAEYSQRVFGRDMSAYLVERQAYFSEWLGRCYCIAPSPFAARTIGDALGISVNVIEHGIIPFVKAPVTPHAGLRLGYIGAHIRQKGWAGLVRVFQSLRQALPAVELHMYGFHTDGPMAPEERLFYHGPYAPDDLGTVCSQIDLAVIPSIFRETFCLTLSELWMGKVPVVASRIGAIGERIEDGVNGRLFDPFNLNDMRRVLHEVITGREWERWAFPYVRTAGEMFADYIQLYRSLVTNSASHQKSL